MGARQAPDGLQSISIDGQLYDVDQTAIDGLKERGIPFDDGSHYKPTMGNADNVALDVGRGAVHGATLGFADKKFGDSNQSVMQRLGGDDYADVKTRSPVATAVGDMGGSLAIPVPGLGAAKVGAGAAKAGGAFWRLAAEKMAANAAEQAAVGGGMGAARAYAEGEDPAKAATLGGILGGAGGALVSGAGSVAAAAKPYVTKALNATADAARAMPFKLVGGSDEQLSQIAAKFGIDKLPERLAGAIEALIPPKGVLGRSQEQYRQELAPIIDRVGPELGALREKLGTEQGLNQLLPDEWATMRQNLQAKLDSTSQRTAKGREEYAALAKDLEEFDKHQPPQTLGGAADVKSEYQSAGHIGKMGSVPEKAAAQSAATIGSEGKGVIDRLLGYATDDSRAKYQALNDEYAVAKLLKEQVDPNALREQFSKNLAGLGSVAAGTLSGAVVGGLSGLAGGSAVDHPGAGVVGGALAGAGAGFNLAAGSGTRNLMTQLLARPQAMDTIANIARASGKKLSQIDLDKLAAYVQSITGKAAGYTAE